MTVRYKEKKQLPIACYNHSHLLKVTLSIPFDIEHIVASHKNESLTMHSLYLEKKRKYMVIMHA